MRCPPVCSLLLACVRLKGGLILSFPDSINEFWRSASKQSTSFVWSRTSLVWAEQALQFKSFSHSASCVNCVTTLCVRHKVRLWHKSLIKRQGCWCLFDGSLGGSLNITCADGDVVTFLADNTSGLELSVFLGFCRRVKIAFYATQSAQAEKTRQISFSTNATFVSYFQHATVCIPP